jgi:hypothetical protein
MGLGLEGAAVGIGASAVTLILSKLRCFCKQGTDGLCAQGCGFTNHSLFDQNEVQLEKATINGVDVIYLKQPGRAAEPDDESSSDEVSNP